MPRLTIRVDVDVPDDKFTPVVLALLQGQGQLTLSQAANLAHMSSRHFTRQWRQSFGHSFRDAGVYARLHIAAVTLASTNLDVSEVMLALGYQSASKFATSFKARYGVSPQQFRSSKMAIGVLNFGASGYNAPSTESAKVRRI